MAAKNPWARPMTREEKALAVTALNIRIERARRLGDRREERKMREWLREVRSVICLDDDFPPSAIPLLRAEQ